MRGLLDSLVELLGEKAPGADKADEPALRMATAILLFEVAKADHQLEPREFDHLRKILKTHWGLLEGELDEVLEEAEREADSSVSLHQQLDLLNNKLGPDQKFQLIKGLWQIANADREIHHYEEHLIRRIADLLYVPHREFIHAKHKALEEC